MMMVVGMAGDTGGPPTEHPGGRRRYRSPFAVVVWWLWALFALANLIDLAVQGRDHFSLETAAGLVLISGAVYIAALRPRITADDDRLTIVNPLREHQIGWPAVAAVEVTELVRVRCAWQVAGEVTRERVIYAWAVHSSRRKQAATRIRAERRRGGGFFSGAAFGSASAGAGGARGYARFPAGSPGWRSGTSGTGQFPAGSPGWRSASTVPATAGDDSPPVGPGSGPAMDAERVAAILAERAEQARSAAGATSAKPPVSRWHWPSVAAIAAPALALILVILLLRRVAWPGVPSGRSTAHPSHRGVARRSELASEASSGKAS
jgi:hypothetical protein